jgi:hypothetical protein
MNEILQIDYGAGYQDSDFHILSWRGTEYYKYLLRGSNPSIHHRIRPKFFHSFYYYYYFIFLSELFFFPRQSEIDNIKFFSPSYTHTHTHTTIYKYGETLQSRESGPCVSRARACVCVVSLHIPTYPDFLSGKRGGAQLPLLPL